MNPKEFNNHDFTTVKATVGGIIYKEGKILLTKRSIPPEKGKWCIPGGHIDIGETALESTLRETKEETGLELKNPKFFGYYDEFLPEIYTHAILLIFYGSPEGKENHNDEVLEQRWFSEKDLNTINIAFGHKRILREFFRKNGQKI
jgi:8-oxo-dGTP diphosphatase